MTGKRENDDVTPHRTALETFAGAGAAPTDGARELTHERAGDERALIDVEVPAEYLRVRGGIGTTERASVTVTDVTFDAETGLSARGHVTAGGTGPDDSTWSCNRPFEDVGLSLSLLEPGSRSKPASDSSMSSSETVARTEATTDDLSVSLAPIDFGDHGVVTLTRVPVALPEHGPTDTRGSLTSLLRAVAALSE